MRTLLSIATLLLLATASWAQRYYPPPPPAYIPTRPGQNTVVYWPINVFPNLSAWYGFNYYGDYSRSYRTNFTKIAPPELEDFPTPPALAPGQAKLTLHVPAAAEVWVEGQKIEQLGTTKAIISPPLDLGQQYKYNVLIKWFNGTKLMERKLTVPLTAGDRPEVTVLQ